MMQADIYTRIFRASDKDGGDYFVVVSAFHCDDEMPARVAAQRVGRAMSDDEAQSVCTQLLQELRDLLVLQGFSIRAVKATA